MLFYWTIDLFPSNKWASIIRKESYLSYRFTNTRYVIINLFHLDGIYADDKSQFPTYEKRFALDKKNKNFLDDSGKFSRTKYEKFLLSQNLTAPFFEINLKNNELKKELFSYVGGGIKTPFFLTNNTYKQQTGKLEIDFINLNNVYKKNQDFSESEIKSFINENKDKLKDEYIDFTYIKITPKDLTGSDQFNELFFKKIDELENKISNGIDFNDLLTVLPVLAAQFKFFLQQKKVLSYLQERQQLSPNSATMWVKKALKNIDANKAILPVTKINFDISEHKGAPLGIWLGLMLDGIPEALVIGAGTAQSGLGYSLLAGLFFSNYPEALSSSSGMRQQGMKFSTVLLMWSTLMLLTGLLSALGSVYFAGISDATFAFTEGVAAGAMLTMIAQTMLPEAYLKGGEIVGFATLLGFLIAIFFKTLE